MPVKLHIICERDVGLFSLVQQVIANIPWALRFGYVPVAYFTDRTCYWTPEGYRGADTVWEYYFEPLVQEYPVAAIPEHIRSLIASNPPVIIERGDRQSVETEAAGYPAGDHTFVCAQYGDHPLLEGKTLPRAPITILAASI
jgi:hypothetical protein